MRVCKTILVSCIGVIIISANALADNCPSPTQIKQGNLGGWIVYLCPYSSGYNSCRPAPAKEIKDFEGSQIIWTGSAYWFGPNSFPHNSMCIYGGTSYPLPLNDQLALFKSEQKPSGAQWKVLGTDPYVTMVCDLNDDASNCSYP